MFADILVPTDGSDEADAAVDHGIDLAERYDATVHAVHVVDPHVLGRVSEVEPAKERGRELVAAVADRSRDRGVSVETEVRSGFPHAEILEYTTEHGIDLISMGRQGRGRLERYLVGSVADHVLRRATLPVLTVNADGELHYPYEHVLVPTDGSRMASEAVAVGVELAARYDATLHALSVIDPQSHGFDVRSVAVQDELEDRATEAVEAVETRAHEAGISTVETSTVHGRPNRAIREYVEDHEIDLVAMGSQGRTGLDRLFLGSVTRRVLQSVPVPVMAVRRPLDELEDASADAAADDGRDADAA